MDEVRKTTLIQANQLLLHRMFALMAVPASSSRHSLPTDTEVAVDNQKPDGGDQDLGA